MFRAASDPIPQQLSLHNGAFGRDDASRARGTVFLNRWLIGTLLAMFPLIWFGGLTTSHGAGLAVPDWPNTYGYNMFAVPLSLWLSESAGGIFFEHTHRLLGSMTGLLAVGAALCAWGAGANRFARRWFGWTSAGLCALAITSVAMLWASSGGAGRAAGHAASGFGGLAVVFFLAWLARTREPRRWVRWGATALLLMIIMQGVLGGLRVTEVNLELAIVHGVFAQVTFCFAGLLALVTGAWWRRVAIGNDVPGTMPSPFPNPAHKLLFASAALTLLVLGQLAIAAMMRHYQAGLAVPDFPLSYGKLVPPISSAGLEHANEARAFDLSLPRTTLGQIWLHTAHRLGALMIAVGFVWVGLELRRTRGNASLASLRRHGWLLGGLLLLQVGLGVATVWMGKPADVATAHVATGALFFLSSSLLTARLLRLRHMASPVSVAPSEDLPKSTFAPATKRHVPGDSSAALGAARA